MRPDPGFVRPRPAIRPARAGDGAGIAAVYNRFVAESTSTWQTEPDTAESREHWIAGRDAARHPVYVATDDAGRVIAFAALSPYSNRGGFADLAEVAIYLAETAQGQGLGSRLLQTLLEAAAGAKLHGLVARVSGDQPASLALHRKFGFVQTGVIPEAGCKFGRRLDLVYLHRRVG